LIRILHNIHYSTSRRDSRQPVAVEQEHLEASAGNGAGYTNGNGNGHHDTLPPLRLDSMDAMDQRLVRALNRLPEEYRVVMLLWAVEELSYKEIADAVEVPIGTVMSRLHRAKQRLAEQLQDFAKDHRILRE
jgi:RNA polymerase sigma-70 factor (ECF subfamily)